MVLRLCTREENSGTLGASVGDMWLEPLVHTVFKLQDIGGTFPRAGGLNGVTPGLTALTATRERDGRRTTPSLLPREEA